jgi:hypothetical protein
MSHEAFETQVDIFRRTDFVGLVREDRSETGCVIIGQTHLHNALDSQPVWQLRRLSYVAPGVLSTEYADHGKYNQVWDNRVAIFGPCPPGAIEVPGYPPTTVPFHTAVGTIVTDGTEQTVATFLVPAGTNRSLTVGNITTTATGTARIRRGATEIHAKRTTNDIQNIELKFNPEYPIIAGDVIALTFERTSGGPSTVQGFISATDTI